MNHDEQTRINPFRLLKDYPLRWRWKMILALFHLAWEDRRLWPRKIHFLFYGQCMWREMDKIDEELKQRGIPSPRSKDVG